MRRLLEILCYISVFQILLISFYLFIRKRGNKLNRILIVSLLIIWGIFISGSYILLLRSKSLYIYDLGHLMNLTIFLVAPVLYIHFKSLFDTDYSFSYKESVHALPFLLILAFLFNEIILNHHVKYVFYPTAIYLIIGLFFQNIVYFFIITKKLILQSKENNEKSKLKLYRFLFSGGVTVFALKLIIFVVWNILQYNDICIFLTGIFFIIVFVIVNSFIIFSLNNPELLTGTFRYQNSGLSADELTVYLNQINDYLNRTKEFTEPLLSLERLAKSLKLQEKLLSQVINQGGGLNFNDFINSFRICYAKELIIKDSSKKILEIAYESGFNSKTTFNSAFRKFTGQTPSEYKKNSAPA